MHQPLIGRTVALTQCPCFGDLGDDARASGLWTVEEYHPYEPSNYVSEDCFSLAAEREGITVWITVNAYDLLEQVDPQTHGQMLVSEREMEFASYD